MFLDIVSFLPLTLLAVLVLLVLAGKSEPDVKRERPAALYLGVISLVGVIFLLGATFFVANGLVELTDTEPTGFSFSTRGEEVGPDEFLDGDFGQNRPRRIGDDFGRNVNHDDDVSQIIGGLIMGALAFAVIRFHAPKLQDLADNSDGPGARIYARHLYVVCGVTLLTAVGAAGAAIYGVYGMIAPDTASAGDVTDSLRSLLSAAALALVAAYLFRQHWQRSEDLAAVAVAVESEAAVVVPAKAARVRKAAPPKE
jgi:hypothetical protein